MSRRRSRAVILFAAVPFAAFFSSSHALGANYTWGGSTGNWATAGNWTGNAAPSGSGGDILLFPAAGTDAYTATNNLTFNPANIGQILLSSTSTNTQTLTGAALTLNGAPSEIIQNGSGAFNIFNNIAIPFSGVTFGGAGTGDITLAGVLSGGATLFKSSPGTLTLAGVNTRTGGTTIVAGTLAVTNDSALGTGGVSFGGGTLQLDSFSSSLNFSNFSNIKLGAGVGAPATLAGVISNISSLNYVGPGTLILSNANTFFANTTITAGTLAITSDAGLGTNTNSVPTFAGGALQFNSYKSTRNFFSVPNLKLGAATGAPATLAGSISGSSSLTYVGPGTLTLSGSNSYSGGTTLVAGALAIGSDVVLSSSSTPTFAGGALQFNNYSTFRSFSNIPNLTLGAATGAPSTFNGSISGTSSFTFVGPGTLLFSGSGSYTGGTTLAGGTLASTTDSAFGTGNIVPTFAGGILQFNNRSSFYAFANVPNLKLGAATGSASSLFGQLSGSLPLTYVGPGTLALNGSNSAFTGGVVIADGILVASSTFNLGSTPPSFAGGTLQLSSSSSLNFANQPSLQLGVATGSSLTLSGAITGNSSLTFVGPGSLLLQGINTYSGPTAVTGGTLIAPSNSIVGTGAAITVAANGTLATSGILQRAISGAGTLTATGTLLAGDPLSNAGFSFAGTLNVNSNTMLFLSSSLSHLSGQVNLSPGAHLNSLNGLQLDSTSVLSATGPFTVDGAFTNLGSLNTPGLAVTNSFTQSSPIPASVGALTGGGSVTVSSGTTLAATTVSLAALTLESGATATLAAHSAVSLLNALVLAPTATLDVADNDVIVTYSGPSPAATIRSYLISGFNAGAWNGSGIASAAAHADTDSLTALGYFDNTSDVIVKYTYYGDTNLDGNVDTTDFQMFLDGLAATNASSWTQGDYTYDGKVDLGNDFNLFLRGYLSQGGVLGDLAPIIANDTLLTGSQKAQLLAAVPEPSALLLSLPLAAILTLRKKRKGPPDSAE